MSKHMSEERIASLIANLNFCDEAIKTRSVYLDLLNISLILKHLDLMARTDYLSESERFAAIDSFTQKAFNLNQSSLGVVEAELKKHRFQLPDLIAKFGVVHSQNKNFEKASTFFRIALEANETAINSYNLAHSLYHRGELLDALVAVSKAVEGDASFSTARYLRSNINVALGRYRDALLDVNYLLKSTSDTNTLLLRSKILFELREYNEAFSSLHKINKLSDKNPVVNNRLGDAHVLTGEPSSAKLYFRKAYELSNQESKYLLNYAQCLSGEEDPWFLEEAFKKQDDPHLLLAQSIFFGKISDYENSWRCLKDANKIFCCIRPSSQPPAIREFLLENFDGTQESENLLPVFIIGLPRSGSTYLSKLLEDNFMLCNLGELPYIDNLSKQFKTDHFLSAETIKNMRNNYFKLVRQHRLSENIFIDKMPMNYLHSDLISLCFPEAKIIFLSREYDALKFSLFKTYFPNNVLNYTFSSNDIDTYMSDCSARMSKLAFDNSNFITIQYEELFPSPQNVLLDLKEFIGLSDREGEVRTQFYDTASALQVREVFKDPNIEWSHFKDIVAY